MRTLGYLLHAYVASGEKELYLEESPTYFQSDNPGVQLSELIKSDICGFSRYNLYVWIKAVWIFELYKTPTYREGIRVLVKNILETFKKKKEDFFQHPWSLVFKYLYWICRETKTLKEHADFFKALCFEPVEQDEETVKVIKLFNQYQVGEADVVQAVIGEKAYDSEALKEKITYMYI